MPDLLHTLQGHDLTFLKMVANAWHIEFSAPDFHSGLPALNAAMLDRALLNEMVTALPTEARDALHALMETEGRLPWPQFTRRFGEVRVMGAARRDRERPDLRPASPAEMLWYRAFIGRAFLNLSSDTQEYAYIPDDLLVMLEPPPHSGVEPMGRPATPAESAHARPAGDRILDHACTLLAALRAGQPLTEADTAGWDMPAGVLQDLLAGAAFLDETGLPHPESARAFLAAPRGEALALLAQAWMNSPQFNELRQLPGLVCEGEWANDALQTRRAVLDWLSHLPQTPWWNIAALIAAARERQPDFQRAAGEYDSWFIRRAGSETYLRGFAAWDEVEGMLIRYILTGPLHWLGMLDLAAPEPGAPPSAFRPSGMAAALWHGSPPRSLPKEDAPIRLSADGRLRVPALSPRAARYQIARFCAWEGEKNGEYLYRLTPAALDRARAQGLRPAHLVTLLHRYCPDPLPPGLLQALERWEKFGVQANLESATLLRLSSPEALDALRRSRAARYLGEALNATTVLVRPGGEEAVQRALLELGYLSDRAGKQVTNFPPRGDE